MQFIHRGRVHLAGLTCSLSTEGEQVENSLENTQRPTKNAQFEELEYQQYLDIHEYFISQHKKFYLMVFYDSFFLNSFQRRLFNMYGKKLFSIENIVFYKYLPNLNWQISKSFVLDKQLRKFDFFVNSVTQS